MQNVSHLFPLLVALVLENIKKHGDFLWDCSGDKEHLISCEVPIKKGGDKI